MQFKLPVTKAVVNSKAVVLLLLIVTPIVGFCIWCMFCCLLLCVHSSFVIILMEQRELVALLCLSSWCLVILVWLFLTMPRVWLQFVIVVFLDHTDLLFSIFHHFSFNEQLKFMLSWVEIERSFITTGPG